MDNNLKRALLDLRFDFENLQAFAYGFSNNHLINLSNSMLNKLDLILNEEYNRKKNNCVVIDFNKFKRR